MGWCLVTQQVQGPIIVCVLSLSASLVFRLQHTHHASAGLTHIPFRPNQTEHRGAKMGKDIRVTYKRRHAYATKSNRRQVLRTPGKCFAGVAACL